jgi:hypothetical protein
VSQDRQHNSEVIGKAKFISAEGCAPDKESGKQAHWAGSPLDFISNTMLPLPWIGQVLSSQATWLANWKENRSGRGFEDKED